MITNELRILSKIPVAEFCTHLLHLKPTSNFSRISMLIPLTGLDSGPAPGSGSPWPAATRWIQFHLSRAEGGCSRALRGTAVAQTSSCFMFSLLVNLIKTLCSLSLLSSATIRSLHLTFFTRLCCFSTFFSKTCWVTVLPFFYILTYLQSKE